jgi:hypothetical protein
MNMDNLLKIRTLTERFFEGDTTLAEEQQLYRYYSQPASVLPADLAPYRELFLDLAAVGAASAIPPAASHRRWRPWAAAAVALLLVADGAAVWLNNSRTDDRHEDYVAYIYGERTTDRTVVMAEMQKTMTAMATDGSDSVEEQLKSMFSN